MGRRSRKTRGARGEARAEEIRASLTPIAPGERPAPVTIAAVVAALIAVGNVIAYAAGVHVEHAKAPTLGGILVVSALMGVCAYGLWRRYWAVLGFEAILALTTVFAALSLTVASSVRGALLSLVIAGGCGWLFYKLVRVMARIQMPERARR